MDVNNLEKLKRPQLQQLCKKFGLKASGKNTVLIEALKKQVAQQRVTPTSTPSKSPKKGAAASKCRQANAANPSPSPHSPAALPDAGKAVPATKRGGRRGRPPKSKKSPVVSPARVNASPSKSPVFSPTQANASPSKSPVFSPTQANAPPSKSPVVSPVQVGGFATSPAVSPARVRISRSVSSGGGIVVEAAGVPRAAAGSGGGGGSAAVSKRSKTKARKARRPKASARSVDDADVPVLLAPLQPTKRRRSEVGTSPLASSKRSRAAVAAGSPHSLSTKRVSQLVEQCPPACDEPTKSAKSAAASSRKATGKGKRHSRTCSNTSATARPGLKTTGRRGSPLTAVSRSKPSSPTVVPTIPDKGRCARDTASPLLNSTSRVDLSLNSASETDQSPVRKFPLLSITRSPRTSPHASPVAKAAPAKRSVRTSSSAEKKKNKVGSKPSSRVEPVRRTRSSSSPKESTPGLGSTSPDQFASANGDTLSPLSPNSTRRGTFTLTPSPAHSAEPEPRKRASTTLSSAAGRSMTASPAWCSPDISIDALKESILADLNQKVASQLPPADPSVTIPGVGFSSSLTAGSKVKKTTSGKDWASIHKKTFSRMKSIEDDVRERQARRSKLTARAAATTSTTGNVLKDKPKNIPVFQIPDKNKKLVFAFGGKPPTASTTTTAIPTKPTAVPTATAASAKTPRPTAKAAKKQPTKPTAVPVVVAKPALVSSVSRTGSRHSVAFAAAKPRVSISATRTPAKPVDRRKSTATSASRFSFASPGFKSPAASKPKFDLKTSLQRQLTYKPHTGPLTKTPTPSLAAVSRLKAPSVKVFRQRGSPAKEFKRPPLRNHRVESRQNMQQRLKSQRSSAAMANRGLVY